MTWFWDALSDGESPSTTIRNIGLIIVAATAFPIAVWRGIVADKQATAAHSQAEVALRQDVTAQQGLRNERYQKGAEMLGSPVLSVRLGGIYALQRLAEEYTKEYYAQIMSMFTAFVRHPVADEAHVEEVMAKVGRPHIREDVQVVVQAISKQNKEEINLKSDAISHLDLTNADLMYGDLRKAMIAFAYLRRANLYHATLTGADMRSVSLPYADLQKASLEGANLSRAMLYKTKLSDAILSDAILSGAYLSEVIGLTQTQLDQARADPNNPPKLDRALDAKTGEPLVWTGGRGTPLKDEA